MLGVMCVDKDISLVIAISFWTVHRDLWRAFANKLKDQASSRRDKGNLQ